MCEKFWKLKAIFFLAFGLVTAPLYAEAKTCESPNQLDAVLTVVQKVFVNARGLSRIVSGKCELSRTDNGADRQFCVVLKWSSESAYEAARELFGEYFYIDGCIILLENPTSDGTVIVHN